MVSVLAEEHQEACYGSNCFVKMLLQNKERLDRGRDVEKNYSGDRRTYDDSLTVEGDYYEERRSAMQKAGYSDEDIQVRLNQPSPAGYQGEVKENKEHQEKFLGAGAGDRVDATYETVPLGQGSHGQTCCDSH